VYYHSQHTQTVFFRLLDFIHATQATVDNDVLPIYVAKHFKASGLWVNLT